MPNPFFSPTSLTVLENKPLSEPACHLCKLYKTCQTPRMPVSGKGRAGVLVVAEAPGADEDEQGIQLVGKSGKEFESIMRRAGLDMREDCWLTNALICRPPNNEIKDANAVDYCRPNLLKAIKELNPRVIISLGGPANESLIGHYWRKNVGAVERWAGYQIPLQTNTWLCPTFHPAYLLREKDPFLDKLVFNHIKSAVQLKGRPWKRVPNYEEQIEIMHSPSKAARRLKQVKDGVIAFDYETNMLKPDKKISQIYSCSVCHNGKWTIAFPWTGEVIHEMKRILKSRRIKKVGSNIKFEDRWTTAKLKIKIRGWLWDTMLAAHTMENATKLRLITSIKFQAFVKLGQKDWSTGVDGYLSSTRKSGYALNSIHLIDKDKLFLYNGMDSLIEYVVAEKQIKILGGSI